jgi:hypothetical protein
MKTQKLKTIFIAFVLLLGFNSFAKATKIKDNSSIQYSIDSYVDRIKNGFSSDFSSVLADNVKFNIPRNGKIITHGKKEELAFLATQKNTIQQCEVETEVLVKNNNYSLVKVSSIYSSFVREDYVTLMRSNDKWEITDVTTDYK